MQEPIQRSPLPPHCTAASTLVDALRVQGRVIMALLLRDALARYSTQRLGFLWAVLEPCVHIGIWFGIYELLNRTRQFHDMSTEMYLATGIVFLFSFRNIAQAVAGSIKANKGLLKFPMVRQFDALLARFIMQGVISVIVAVAVFGAILAAGRGFLPRDPAGVLGAWACLSALGLGFGSFNAMLYTLVPSYAKVTPVIFRILYFTSGAMIPIAVLPPYLQAYLQWNPVLHGIEKIRSSWSFTYNSASASCGYILLCAAVFLIFALLMDKKVFQEEQGE